MQRLHAIIGAKPKIILAKGLKAFGWFLLIVTLLLTVNQLGYDEFGNFENGFRCSNHEFDSIQDLLMLFRSFLVFVGLSILLPRWYKILSIPFLVLSIMVFSNTTRYGNDMHGRLTSSLAVVDLGTSRLLAHLDADDHNHGYISIWQEKDVFPGLVWSARIASSAGADEPHVAFKTNGKIITCEITENQRERFKNCFTCSDKSGATNLDFLPWNLKPIVKELP